MKTKVISRKESFEGRSGGGAVIFSYVYGKLLQRGSDNTGEGMKVPTWKMNILEMEFSNTIWSEVGIQHDFGGGKKKFVFDMTEGAGGVVWARQEY